MMGFKENLDAALFGGPEPSWAEIREDARRLLRGTKVDGGDQAGYDKAVERLIKPNRGEFSDEGKLLAEAVENQKRLRQEKRVEKYFGDVLGSYQNGVQLDIRVKLAVDFLKSPILQEVACNPNHTPGSIATFALNLATQLLDVAESRGLVKDMPEGDDLSAPMRRHIRRQVRANVVGQISAQEMAAEESPKIAAPNGNALLRQ